MTEFARRIEIAKQSGRLAPENVEAIALGCRLGGAPLEVGFAVSEQETGGRNVWGRFDKSPYVDLGKRGVPVTEEAFWAFYVGVLAGLVPTGCGIVQNTYAGSLKHRKDGTPYRDGGRFKEMLDAGKQPWNPVHQVWYACEELVALKKAHGTWLLAFGHWNGGNEPDMAYGQETEDRRLAWNKSW